MEVLIDFGNDGFKVNAQVSVEGDQWCCFVGNFAEMPAGFGKTIQEAVSNYKCAVRNEKPPFTAQSRPMQHNETQPTTK